MKFRFRFTQLAINLTLVGVLTIAVAALAYFAAAYTVNELSQQVLEQSLLRVDRRARVLLETAEDQTEVSLKLFGRPQMTAADFPQLVQLLSSLLSTGPESSSIFIGLEETGECIGVVREPSGTFSVWELIQRPEGDGLNLRECPVPQYPDGPFKITENWNAYDIRERPWYTEAKSAGTSLWTESYPWIPDGDGTILYGITYAIPVYDDDELVAVVSTDLALNQLSEYLKSLDIGERGYAFIIERRRDGSEHVIAHPKTQLLVGQSTQSGAPQLTPIAQFADGRVREIVDRIDREEISDSSVASDPVPIRIEDEDDLWLGQHMPHSDGDAPPDWIVCTVLPEDEVMGRIHQQRATAIAIFLIVVSVVVGFSYYFASQVSQPLEAMAREAKAIGDLKLDASTPPESIVFEVDVLGRSLESMKTGLRSFKKFVPSDMVESLIGSGQEAAFGGELREITIFFSDIAGFTTITEKLQPDEIVELMREYLSAMSDEVVNAGGTVDKFIGDAVMAFWGAPQINPQHARAACQTALASQERLRELQEKWKSEGRATFDMRIGVHTGDAVVGNFGSEKRLNYTVIGDSVNLASRLEGLNKQYSTSIMISEHTYQAADGVLARPLDLVSVKGKSEAVLVYELLAMDESDPELTELVKTHTSAVESYCEQNWTAAIQMFEQVLNLRPDDPPALQMIERCRQYQEVPPDSDWDGVFRMQTK